MCLSHIHVSVSLSLPLPSSLKSIRTYLQVKIKKKTQKTKDMAKRTHLFGPT